MWPNAPVSWMPWTGSPVKPTVEAPVLLTKMPPVLVAAAALLTVVNKLLAEVPIPVDAEDGQFRDRHVRAGGVGGGRLRR